jgi:hypothetical protein
MKTVDRIGFAARLAEGRRVLDIGGEKLDGQPHPGAFDRAYDRIARAAREYRVANNDGEAGHVDYRLDLSTPEGVRGLRKAIARYRPEVILCMDTLEHVNYHFECMNAMARAVGEWGATVFITVPNNGHWVFNALGWNDDHCVAFRDGIADRFVTRSDLGRHKVTRVPCMHRYAWRWWLVHLAGLFRPFDLGYLVERDLSRNTSEPACATGGRDGVAPASAFNTSPCSSAPPTHQKALRDSRG